MVALVVNAGSTGTKLHTVAADGTATKLTRLEDAPDGLAGTGHRIVHGGDRFREPVLVTDEVVAELEQLVPLAPLHMRPALAALREVRAAFPELPHVAVFDTAFHATLPPTASTYAVPARWRDELGIRRYGFHGISLEWCSERVPALLDVPADELHMVVCHLGGGSSITAVRAGRSVDTTMGFSPLEGVPMTTRSGSIDVEIVLYLVRNGFLTHEQIEHDLTEESGLKALSGLTGDVEQLEDRAADDPRALFALDVYAHRVAAAVGAAATSLARLDALVFTGGIGEHGRLMRARICERLGGLGIALDERRNDTVDEGEIGADGAVPRVVVVRANEELVIARAVFARV